MYEIKTVICAAGRRKKKPEEKAAIVHCFCSCSDTRYCSVAALIVRYISAGIEWNCALSSVTNCAVNVAWIVNSAFAWICCVLNSAAVLLRLEVPLFGGIHCFHFNTRFNVVGILLRSKITKMSEESGLRGHNSVITSHQKASPNGCFSRRVPLSKPLRSKRLGYDKQPKSWLDGLG